MAGRSSLDICSDGKRLGQFSLDVASAILVQPVIIRWTAFWNKLRNTELRFRGS